jgi:hypothetical protein
MTNPVPILVISTLIMLSLSVWIVINQYWFVGRYERARYRIKEGAAVPTRIGKQEKVLHELGFHPLATYVFDPQHRAQGWPLPAVTLENEDSTIKAMVLRQSLLSRGVTFMTLYADGMMLVTHHNMRKTRFSGEARKGDDLYQLIKVKGSLQKAWDDHAAQAAALRAFHGAPLRSDSAIQFSQMLNEAVHPRDLAHVARVIYKYLRDVWTRALVIFFIITGTVLAMSRPTGLQMILLVPAINALVLAPMSLAALILAGRIRLKYLQSSPTLE